MNRFIPIFTGDKRLRILLGLVDVFLILMDINIQI